MLIFCVLYLQEVLKQLQGSIEDEAMASSGQIDLLERLKGRSLKGVLLK
jgi:adenomatosis polyposis coli protein